MKKKIIFGLAILIVINSSFSAQAVEIVHFNYLGNTSEQLFNKAYSEFSQQFIQQSIGESFIINKLHTPVIQEINKNLRDYTLDNGDVFESGVMYQKTGYFIIIRITDAKKSTWQFYAWRAVPY